MEIPIIIALIVAGWFGVKQWQKSEARRAARPKGSGGMGSGQGPGDGSKKWGRDEEDDGMR